jgi:hypothetical protein
MTPLDLHFAACRYVLEQLLPEDLPALAVEALAKGHDAPALVELAGIPCTETDRAHRLWRRALEELGLTLPSIEAAGRALVRDISRNLLSGALDEQDAARRVAHLRIRFDLKDERFHPFVYADSEWSGRPDEAALWIQQVRSAAADLLADDA